MPGATLRGTSSGKDPSGEWQWFLSLPAALLGPRRSPATTGLALGRERREEGRGAWAGGAEEEGLGLGAPEGRGGKTAGRGGREGSEARRRGPAALSLAVNKPLHSNGLCARLRARVSGCLVGGSRAFLALAGGVVEPCGRRTGKSPPGWAGQPPRCWGLRARHRAGQAGGRTLDSRPAVGVPGRPALTARRAGWGYRPRDICGRCLHRDLAAPSTARQGGLGPGGRCNHTSFPGGPERPSRTHLGPGRGVRDT